jgi:hypothetical protein
MKSLLFDTIFVPVQIIKFWKYSPHGNIILYFSVTINAIRHIRVYQMIAMCGRKMIIINTKSFKDGISPK